MSTRRAALDQRIREALVMPLAMIVCDKLSHGPWDVALAEGNYPIETFLF
jgi:hypothetical protein